MLVHLTVLAGLGFLLGSWLHAASLVVLYLIWTQIPEHEGPPILKLAMSSQWAQVSVGLFWSRLTGDVFEVQGLRTYEEMIAIGLGCVLAMTFGLAAGLRLVPAAADDEAGEPRPEFLFDFKTTLTIYASSLVVTSVLTELSFTMPVLRSVLLAITSGRLAIVALVMRRLMRPEVQWLPVLGLLGFEVGLGFTGYFSGFKEPVFLFVLFLLEGFDTRRSTHWFGLAGSAAALFMALTMWMGVRNEYRKEYDDELYASSRAVRLERMQALFTDWLDERHSEGESDAYALVERTWAVYYPALAIDRVPRILPHTNGELLGGALLHAVTPRFLFPDKAELINDSDLVRRYSGVWVAGTEEGTSIAFGYAAEGYVDFGVPLMFLPVFLFGLGMGAIFSFFLRLIAHRELAVSLVVCIFWYNLFLYERAWAKMLGVSVAMFIYLGGISFLADRYVLTERSKRDEGFQPVPAYPDR